MRVRHGPGGRDDVAYYAEWRRNDRLADRRRALHRLLVHASARGPRRVLPRVPLRHTYGGVRVPLRVRRLQYLNVHVCGPHDNHGGVKAGNSAQLCLLCFLHAAPRVPLVQDGTSSHHALQH